MALQPIEKSLRRNNLSTPAVFSTLISPIKKDAGGQQNDFSPVTYLDSKNQRQKRTKSGSEFSNTSISKMNNNIALRQE